MTQALLIAGHGTRDPRGRAECLDLAGEVRSRRPGLEVAVGFLELCPPPLSAAVGDLVGGGVGDLTVLPLTLLAASHAKGDLPAAVVRARRDHPGVTVRYGAPLGIHPDLVDLVDDRLRAAVPAGERDQTAVVLVGRGSTDPDANADLHKVARLLWEGRTWPLVEPAFVSLTGPRVPEALERCRLLGACRVAVMPYFLFTGVLERRIRSQASRFAAAHPEVALAVTSHLGPDGRVARLLLERYEQARAGAVQANCDTCMYRVALPGFEHRVGQAQTLHPHPHDPATPDHPHPHHRTAPHLAPDGRGRDAVTPTPGQSHPEDDRGEPAAGGALSGDAAESPADRALRGAAGRRTGRR